MSEAESQATEQENAQLQPQQLYVTEEEMQFLAQPAVLARIVHGCVQDCVHMSPETIQEGLEVEVVSPPLLLPFWGHLVQEIWFRLSMPDKERPQIMVLSVRWEVLNESEYDRAVPLPAFDPPWLETEVDYQISVSGSIAGPESKIEHSLRKLEAVRRDGEDGRTETIFSRLISDVSLGSPEEALDKFEEASSDEQRAEWDALYLLDAIFCLPLPSDVKIAGLAKGLGLPDIDSD